MAAECEPFTRFFSSLLDENVEWTPADLRKMAVALEAAARMLTA